VVDRDLTKRDGARRPGVRYTRPMGEAAKRILDEVMTLSDEERELITVEQNARLQTHDPSWEAEWSVEIERRMEEIRTGAVEFISWDELRAARRARRGR